MIFPYNGDDGISSDRWDKSRAASRWKPNESEPVNSHGKDAPSKSSTDVPQKLFLGEYTAAANNTVDSIQAAQTSLEDLANQFKRHLEEITAITNKRHILDDLHQQNRAKETKIAEQSITIRIMGDELHIQKKRACRQRTRR